MKNEGWIFQELLSTRFDEIAVDCINTPERKELKTKQIKLSSQLMETLPEDTRQTYLELEDVQINAEAQYARYSYIRGIADGCKLYKGLYDINEREEV